MNNYGVVQVENNEDKKVRNKHKIYVQEREQILNQIYGLIGISDTNKIFYSHNITLNDELKQQLLNLENNLKKYYATSSWSTFKVTIDVENKALSIIRMVLKEHNINYKSTPIKVKLGIKIISSTQYEIY